MNIATTPTSTTADPMRRALVVGALGVVYGDIGTSPIYTLRECLKAAGGGNVTDVVRWGVMTIGTGLVNARFTNRFPSQE